MWGIELIVMLAMIAVNSVLAAYEIALASITLSRLQRLSAENVGGASDATYMKENMEASLAVIQLGITLVAAIAAAVGGAGAEEQIAPWLRTTLRLGENTADFLSLVCLIVPLTVVTIVFGELVPKVFALRNSQSVCLRLSPPMRWFSVSVWPIVWFFETVVRGITSWGESRLKRAGRGGIDEMSELHDLRASAALARASRLIGSRQEDIILGAAEMQDRPVKEIMLPAEHISTLDAYATLSDNLLAAHLDMHTRFPVERVRGDRQSIIGYVNVKDLISTLRVNPADASMHSIIRKLPDLKIDQPLLSCLEKLMRAHTHIALVKDAGQKIVGMISLEDIIEELVGEIEDEYDRLPGHIAETGQGWTVGGGVTMRRFRATSHSKSPPTVDDGETLNDWAVRQLGRGIEGGDIINADGLRVLVRKVRRQQLQEASISLN
jgi:putative hemolysin